MSTQHETLQANYGNNPLLNLIARLSRLAGWISATMIVFAVLITCEMIFVRFVLNHSTIWQTEFVVYAMIASTIWQTEAVVYLMISATLLGLPYVQLLRGHVNVDLLPLMLPIKARYALALFTLCLSIAMVVIMLYYGFDFWHEAWSRNWKSDTVWGVRLWIPYLSLPVGFALFLLQLLADLFAVITRVDKPFGLEEGH